MASKAAYVETPRRGLMLTLLSTGNSCRKYFHMQRPGKNGKALIAGT